jgi:hypothetical protein
MQLLEQLQPHLPITIKNHIQKLHLVNPLTKVLSAVYLLPPHHHRLAVLNQFRTKRAHPSRRRVFSPTDDAACTQRKLQEKGKWN